MCINVKVCFPQKCQHTTAWQGQQQAQLNDYNDYNLRKETAALGHVQSMTRQIAIKDNALGTYEKKREEKGNENNTEPEFKEEEKIFAGRLTGGQECLAMDTEKWRHILSTGCTQFSDTFPVRRNLKCSHRGHVCECRRKHSSSRGIMGVFMICFSRTFCLLSSSTSLINTTKPTARYTHRVCIVLPKILNGNEI